MPYIDQVTGLEITEVATTLTGLRTGKIDYVGWQGANPINSIDQRESLERTDPELVVHAWSERSEACHLFNINKSPFGAGQNYVFFSSLWIDSELKQEMGH